MAGLKTFPFVVVAQQIFLLLIFSLAFTQPAIPLLGFDAVATDFVYLALIAAWSGAVTTGQIRLRSDPILLAVALYLAAMGLSAAASADPARSATKLLTQFYLLSLPVIAASLVTDERFLRRAFNWWLAATAVVAALAILSLILFVLAPGASLLAVTINEFGTLPPGPYPRLRVTFMIGNLLCNYLSVGLMILLAARHRAWIAHNPFLLLLAGLLITAFFTLSPSLGGIVLALGLWFWLIDRERRPMRARLALAAGLGGAALFIAVMSFTPIIHPTAPFLVHVPILDLTLAPSVRLMVWIDAVRNFLSEPLLGRGIGLDAVDVFFIIPANEPRVLTDAHNAFLSIAVQCGIVGLAALLALIGTVAARTLPLRLRPNGSNAVRLALGLAFLNGLAYQGLGGSFEDARHLWVALGLFIAAGRIEGGANPTLSRADVRAHS